MNGKLNNFHAARYEVNLVTDTVEVADGDVLSESVAILLLTPLAPAAVPVRGTIESITILDKDDEGKAFDLVVLDANVSIGTLNAAAGISDANAEKVVAVVPVAAADYKDLGGCKVARPSFDPIPFESADGSIYIGAIAREAVTFTAASDLRLKVMVRLDNVNL